MGRGGVSVHSKVGGGGWRGPSDPLWSPPHPLPCAAGGQVLQLPAVREEDAGRFTCEAANAAGQDRLHYQLEVLSEYGAGAGARSRRRHGQHRNSLLPATPAIHGGTEDLAEEVTATINGTVQFKCEATGHPVPTVSWLWNNIPIAVSPRHQLLEGGTVLQVSVPLGRVALPGQDTGDAGWRGWGTFPYPRRLPWSSHGSPSSSLARGSPQCGSASPLQVPAVEVGDAGSYTCMAENPAGSAEKHFALTVQGKVSQ